jgi:hypothetical protein
MALSKHHRHRSSSDPFSDPPALSYSSYGVPTLSSYQQQQQRAPAVPPKVPAKQSKRTRTKPAMATEVVTTTRSSSDQPRTRMGRSQTQLPPYVEFSRFGPLSHPHSLLLPLQPYGIPPSARTATPVSLSRLNSAASGHSGESEGNLPSQPTEEGLLSCRCHR